jgi:ABC-type transporter Mla maintaining outer membrane lipid asymmetry ATPase subunit MlaF
MRSTPDSNGSSGSERSATRFLVIRDGRVYFDGAPEELAASHDPYLKGFLV